MNSFNRMPVSLNQDDSDQFYYKNLHLAAVP